jgi:prepilin-type N-terminal cleavage/methylation domain-containing protein
MKTFKKIMSNQSGMSLIEVIVAAAISVIISGAVMKTNESGIKGMNSVSTKINLDMWKSTVLTAKFNDPAVCKANFDSLGWTPGGGVPAAATLFNEDGSVFLNGNDTINGTQGDWKFIGVTVNPFSADPGATTKGNCNVKVTVENNKSKMSFGTKQKVITIPIRCNLDSGATTLVSCSGSSDGMDSLWIQQLAGTNPGYIYRSDNVLIGPAGQVVDTPFQINMESPIEWPASGSGVRASMRITGDDAVVGQPAMIFNQSGLYEDASGCLITAVDNGVGNIFEASKACNGSFAIGSFSSMTINPSPGGRTNVAIASGGSTVDGHWSTVISSEGSTASGDLTMALGSRSSLATGSLSSVISANGSMAYPSRASGVGSVVLGASNVHVGGDYSIGLGIKNIITGNRSVTIGDSLIQAGDNSLSVGYSLANSGQNSITFGSRNSNSFANSVIGGFQSNITGTGGNSLVVSWKSDIKDSYHMTTLGANNYVNCSYCGAYGTDIDIRHDDSFVMGSWRTSNRALKSSKTEQITMGANNGYRFFTDSSSTTSAAAEAGAVYIDASGNMGIGKDPDYLLGAPKLYVNGKVTAVGRQFSFASNAQDFSNVSTDTVAFNVGASNSFNDSTASGSPPHHLVGMGRANVLTGGDNVAIGWGNTVSGRFSYAIGVNSEATVYPSFAFGNHCKSKATDTYCFGKQGNVVNSGAMVIKEGTSTVLSSTASNQLSMMFRGGYRLFSNSGASTGVTMAAGASAWSTLSDKNKKENFEKVDGEYVLREIQRMDITKWNYIGGDEKNKEGDVAFHIGPMAQDFWQAFGIGHNDITILTQDISGVNMKGVQALADRTDRLKAENEDLKKRVAKLEALVEKLLQEK